MVEARAAGNPRATTTSIKGATSRSPRTPETKRQRNETYHKNYSLLSEIEGGRVATTQKVKRAPCIMEREKETIERQEAKVCV